MSLKDIEFSLTVKMSKRLDNKVRIYFSSVMTSAFRLGDTSGFFLNFFNCEMKATNTKYFKN